MKGDKGMKGDTEIILGRSIRFPAAVVTCLFLVAAAYANHFHNSLHFDDFHTITQNPFIRSLANVSRFFTDARTFSILPSHYSYRPLFSASLAVDYRLGNGLDPLWFHISTFAWFTVQLALMYLLFTKIMDLCRPGPQNAWLAMLAVAWYGLHPANAEHFRRALALAPEDSQSYSFYGSWLQSQARLSEATTVLERAAQLNPAALDARYTLMLIYSAQSDWADLKRVAGQILLMAPGDEAALRYSALAQKAEARVTAGGQTTEFKSKHQNRQVPSFRTETGAPLPGTALPNAANSDEKLLARYFT
jgi:tetratricopeptide (TPR) repeat protein